MRYKKQLNIYAFVRTAKQFTQDLLNTNIKEITDLQKANLAELKPICNKLVQLIDKRTMPKPQPKPPAE